MPKTSSTLAVFPGAFDPVTCGHLDIIERGRRLFPRLIVGVGHNPEKTMLFTPEERVAMIRSLTANMPNVTVEHYDGLTADFVRSVGANVILRGVRDFVDLRNELQQANTNLIVGGIETVFLLTSTEHALTSSTLIKQIVEMGGGDPSRLQRIVPPTVVEKLREKLHKKF